MNTFEGLEKLCFVCGLFHSPTVLSPLYTFLEILYVALIRKMFLFKISYSKCIQTQKYQQLEHKKQIKRAASICLILMNTVSQERLACYLLQFVASLLQHPHLVEPCNDGAIILSRNGKSLLFGHSAPDTDELHRLLLQISDIQVNGQSDDMTAKEKLLLWSQRMVEGYQGLRCDNFTGSWRDGKLFNAIIHKHRWEAEDQG